jgi:hypothetical protein
MQGVSQSCDELTSDLGNQTTASLITDFDLPSIPPRKLLPSDFGLLQHYRWKATDWPVGLAHL